MKKFSKVVRVYAYGDFGDRLNYAFQLTSCHPTEGGKRRHAYNGQSFVINRNSRGWQKVKNGIGEICIPAPPPELADPRDQLCWLLGRCLNESLKLG